MTLKRIKKALMPDSIFGGFIYGLVKHLMWIVRSPAYRQHALFVTRYAHLPRYKAKSIKLNGRLLEVPDVASFLSTHHELFVNRIYEFESDKDNPIILDFGANIGLSVLYFKSLYPLSTIIAYEADPDIFQFLKKNVGDLPGVILHNRAVWTENTKLSFNSDGADGGCVVISEEADRIDVDAVDIRDVIDESNADFIKMDIEGAESLVIPACKGRLHSVKHIFCEYHSRVNESQELDCILSTLSSEGFRLHIQSINPSYRPFVSHDAQAGFDMQLNIFGWKEC